MINPETDLVTLRTYALEFQAQADRAYLEAEGIPALVLSDEPVLNHGTGVYKLIVPRLLEGQALGVINQAPSTGDDDEAACLACGEPMAEDERRCGECGWSFADGAEADEDWVILRTYSGEDDVELDRCHLETAGILAVVQNVGLESQIRVPRSQQDEAEQILGPHRPFKTIFSPEPEIEEMANCLACNAPMPEGLERCPRCGWSYEDGAETEDPE
jgi:hypothetical protein